MPKCSHCWCYCPTHLKVLNIIWNNLVIMVPGFSIVLLLKLHWEGRILIVFQGLLWVASIPCSLVEFMLEDTQINTRGVSCLINLIKHPKGVSKVTFLRFSGYQWSVLHFQESFSSDSHKKLLWKQNSCCVEGKAFLCISSWLIGNKSRYL